MTLRAPRPHQIQHADDTDTYTPEVLQPRRMSGIPLAAAIALVLLVASFLVVSGGRASTALTPSTLPMPPATAIPAKETIIITQTPVPTPDCVSVASQLALIESLTGKGDWEGGAREADAVLTIAKLCESDRKRLTEKAVITGLQALYNQKFESLDEKSHQQEVDRFLTLRERARLSGVDFPTPLQVARASYSISQFRLTVAAVEIALSEGDYNPQLDRDTTKLYISALYGLGYWYTQAPEDSDLYNLGLAYLSASHRLAVQFKTGQGEAAALLTKRIGADETHWPAPYRSPLLNP
jgi:hypothetical protein